MLILTAENLYDLNFIMDDCDRNNYSEDFYTDENEITKFVFGADGYCVFKNEVGIELSFCWGSQSDYVLDGQEYSHKIELHPHNMELVLKNCILVDEDGEILSEIDAHDALTYLIEKILCWESDVKNLLPTLSNKYC